MVSQKQHHRFMCAFFDGNPVFGQLNLDRFEFWLPTSQRLMLDVFLLNDFS
ncbi:DUF645 family protein (plasmid) [Vibrio sp. HDW18]|uniref:DUF645 family protein n=1 Tax=Vibrio sp. HDW18 TaxID=2714948 RepID=UPI00140A3C03|nr:DUF645 family protein [Vibrio sp. HDW18]EKF9745958.1 DUF645 family protein [Vibrio cholerae]QIL87086.1 DUF645 family protein [Vibrio sp. HDW18]